MTAPVTPVALLREQLNLAPEDATDAFLTHKLAAAEAWIASHIGAPLPNPLPAPITEAALMLAAHLFENREATLIGVNGSVLPYGVAELLSSHRQAVTGHVAA